jgi:ribose transport system permease protein
MSAGQIRARGQVGVRGPAVVRDFGSRFAIIGVWLLMCLIYGVAEPSKFLNINTAQTIFSSQAPLVFLTMALLCTLCVGEFVDLSVASVLGLSAVIVPVLSVEHGWNVWLASVIALVVSLAAGVINGLLVVYLGVNVVAVTLGMSTLLLGIALWVTDLTEQTGLSQSYGEFANHTLLGLPLDFYYGLILVLAFAYLLMLTPVGRHIRFVGSNPEVSRLAGVRVRRIRFSAFVVAGFLAGLGGVITAASLGGFDPNSSQTYLLPTFAATFLGTAIIQPGRFNPLGTFIGIYFLETGIVGLELLGVAGWVSDVFYGGVLVIAVAITTIIRRRRRH